MQPVGLHVMHVTIIIKIDMATEKNITPDIPEARQTVKPKGGRAEDL